MWHRLVPGEHPAAGEGLWGTDDEVPSFLYAMPTAGGGAPRCHLRLAGPHVTSSSNSMLSETAHTYLDLDVHGLRSVFLEETCLVAKPALPFAVLKRRLERRLSAHGRQGERAPPPPSHLSYEG